MITIGIDPNAGHGWFREFGATRDWAEPDGSLDRWIARPMDRSTDFCRFCSIAAELAARADKPTFRDAGELAKIDAAAPFRLGRRVVLLGDGGIGGIAMSVTANTKN